MRERFATVMWLIGCAGYPLILYFLISNLTSVGMIQFGMDPFGEDGMICSAVSALITAIPLGLLYRRGRACMPQVRHWNRMAGVWTVLVGIGGCFFLNNLIALVELTSKAYQEASSQLYRPSFGIQIAAIGIVIPVTEELIFRGFGFAQMRRKRSFVWAAIVSAVIFGIYHGNVVQFVYAGCLGLLLSGVYEAYRSLWAPICLHIAANMSSLLFMNLLPEEIQHQVPKGALILVFGAVMMFGIYKIREDVKKREITVNCNPLL